MISRKYTIRPNKHDRRHKHCASGFCIKKPYFLTLIGLFLTATVFISFPQNTFAADTRLAQNDATQKKFRFCYQDVELFPAYTENSPNKPATNPGVDIEIIDLVAAQVGVDVEYFRYSWNRCLALLKAGRIDSVIASYNEDRTEIARFPMDYDIPDIQKRITTASYYLYHLGQEPMWDGTLLLDPGIVVAAPLGYSIVRVLNSYGFNVMETSTTVELLNLLTYNRVDAVAAPGNAADEIIRSDFTRYSEVVKDPIPLRENAYFVVFSHQYTNENPALVRAFWGAMPGVIDAHRDTILKKYQNQ